MTKRAAAAAANWVRIAGHFAVAGSPRLHLPCAHRARRRGSHARLAVRARPLLPDPLPFWLFCAVGSLLSAFVWVAFQQWGWVTLLFALLVAIGVRDSLQTRHAVLRNYPVIGHLRFLLEFIRPEIRQYFIESDNEAHPFSRQQRSLVYQRAKGDPDKRPFGTQLDVGRARLRVDQPLADAHAACRRTTSAC